jgi:hypothetical protein
MGCTCGSSDVEAIDVYRGDTIEMTVAIQKTDALYGTVTPYDLTGAKVWCTLKRGTEDHDNVAIAQVSTTGSVPAGGGITIRSPATAGIVDIIVPSAATVGLQPIEQYLLYDVQLKDAGGVIRTVATGKVRVLPDVTNAVS